MLYQFIRPLLFKMPAEMAHNVALDLMKTSSWAMPNPKFSGHPVSVMGVDFPNRVGLAAGMDKNGAYIQSLAKFGFGFIEVGTVTPKPQLGNPKPRLFRVPEKKAIINRMGFNNEGVDALVNRVKQTQYNGILGINLGKNKDTPNEHAIDDYLIGLNATYEYADYIVINISSPNTQGLRALQSPESIINLIEQLKASQLKLSENYGYKPIVIKIAPDLTEQAVLELADIFLTLKIDGVTATNTTIDKQSVSHLPNGEEQGGLSGEPLQSQSTNVIRLLSQKLGQTIPIVGVGGINSVDSAKEKLEAGASLVQLYSGLIYQGPNLIKQLANQL